MKAVLIGAGHMGRYHADKLAACKGVTLAGVVDADAGRARELAAKHDVIGDVRERDVVHLHGQRVWSTDYLYRHLPKAKAPVVTQGPRFGPERDFMCVSNGSAGSRADPFNQVLRALARSSRARRLHLIRSGRHESAPA